MRVIKTGTNYEHRSRVKELPHDYTFILVTDTNIAMDNVMATRLGKRMEEYSKEQPADFPLNFVATDPIGLSDNWRVTLYGSLVPQNAPRQVIKVLPTGDGRVISMRVLTEAEFTGDQRRNFERILEKSLENALKENSK